MAYTTLPAVKARMGITSATDDAWLEDLIAQAQKLVEMELGRVFEASANTTRYFDAECDVDGATLYLDKDLCSINSITNGDGTTVTAGQYVTEPRNETPYYAIRLKSSAAIAWTYSTDPENAIAISGKWAWSAAAPRDIVQATEMLVAYLYQQRGQENYSSIQVEDLKVTLAKKDSAVHDLLGSVAYYRRIAG